MKSERRKKFGKALIFVILLAMLAFVSVGCASATTIWVPSPGNETIQQAVNNAIAGDTIIVRDDTYTENVDVNVDYLTIRSENGSENCIVQAANSNDYVFEVTTDYVNISGFTVKGSNTAGMRLQYADKSTISNNTVSDNGGGIYLWGLNNNNMLMNNLASNNHAVGIWLSSSSNNNTLTDNLASNNDCGIYLESSSNNTLMNNNADSNDYYGILLHDSSNNTLANNNASNNGYGIRLESLSINNRIYNNYFDNTNNAYDEGDNIWNVSKTAGTNIIGGSYLGGNYWSDYAGMDTDGYGLGDTLLPYNSSGDIQNGGDWLPLTTTVTPPSTVYIRSKQDFMERKYVANGSFSSSPSDMVYRLHLKIYAIDGQFTVPKIVIFNTTSIDTDRTFYKVDDVSLGHGNIVAFPDHIEWTGNNETVSSYFELGIHELNTHELTPPISSFRLVEKEVFDGNETITMTFNATPTDNLDDLEITVFAEETGHADSILLVETATNQEFIDESSTEKIKWDFDDPVIGQTYSASINLTVTTKTDSTTRYWAYTRIEGSYGSYTNSSSGSNQSMVEYTDSILGNVQIYFEKPVNYTIDANGKGRYYERFKHFSEIVEGGEPNTIGISHNAYKPGVRTVPVGTTVKWSNWEELVHTVMSDTGLWDSGNLSDGQSFSYTFNTTGMYTYHDALHPSVVGVVIVYTLPAVFDTGEGTYPSIMGTHKGEIKPSDNINVSKLYTYPCAGTGGHTESIELYENETLIASGVWNGYQGDYHNLTITPSVTLREGHEYRYVIKTGSYPQIIHAKSKNVTGGTITCDKFIDANGKTYTDWIPAIRLEE